MSDIAFTLSDNDLTQLLCDFNPSSTGPIISYGPPASCEINHDHVFRHQKELVI
jgi:hypothetical protein